MARERKSIAKPSAKHENKLRYQEQKNDEKPKQSNFWVKTLSFFPILLLVTCYVLFMKRKPDILTFAKADSVIERAFHAVPCSKDYEEEIFNECKPKKCGRVVMDSIVSEEEASFLLSIAKKGLSLGGSSGGASILDLHSGALSHGDKFINVFSIISELGEKIFTVEDFEVYRKVKDKIHNVIAKEFEVSPDKLYLTKPTFFSRMNMTEAKTVHDEYWHPHIDKVTYGSFHYTSLLYLATYRQDFHGGRFVFVDKTRNMTVEPRLGRVSFFTSGSENVHFVEQLKEGVRYAITIVEWIQEDGQQLEVMRVMQSGKKNI